MASQSRYFRALEPERAELDPLLTKIVNMLKDNFRCHLIRFKSPLAEKQFFRLVDKILQTGNIYLYQNAILKLFEDGVEK